MISVFWHVVNLEGDNLLRSIEWSMGHAWVSATIIAFFGSYFAPFIDESPFKDINFLPEGMANRFIAPEALG